MPVASKNSKLEIMSNIVVTYLNNNKLSAKAVPTLIRSVQDALNESSTTQSIAPEKVTPAKRRGRPPMKRRGRPPKIAVETVAKKAQTTVQSPGIFPAVPVSKSLTDDYLICLEDGKQLKMLKRYLRTRYQMTPDRYRKKWGLPDTYPMVAPNYAKRRSALARNMGLGQKGIAARRRKAGTQKK